MDNLSAQNEELIALQSIFDEKDLFVLHEVPPSGRATVNVHLPKPFFVLRKELVSCNIKSETDFEKEQLIKIEIEHLPPLVLFFEFPETYPLESCPAFLLSCNWLEMELLSQLCKKLESIWQEGLGEVVIFQWISFLQDEALEYLGISDSLDLTRLSRYRACNFQYSLSPNVVPSENLKNTSEENKSSNNFVKNTASVLSHEISSLPTPDVENETCFEVFDIVNEQKQQKLIKPCISGGFELYDQRAVLDLINGASLLKILEEYNRNKTLDVFQNSWFLCMVCFTEKKGSDFIRFNKCNHMYCRDCLKSYFEIQIKDGNVHSLNCPEEKCSSQADSAQVKELVGIELFSKYDTLLLSRTLEGMSDVVYCPRQFCQCALVADQESRMGHCPACNFVFCLFCRMAYHGIAPCSLKAEEKKELCNKYLESKGVEKLELERRYGKHVLQLLVENTMSEEWVTSNSKQCPHCRASIEKTDGCNKMTCFRCGTYFCWLCMSQLKPTNPYSHFSERGSSCFDKLFPDNYYDDILPGQFLGAL